MTPRQLAAFRRVYDTVSDVVDVVVTAALAIVPVAFAAFIIAKVGWDAGGIAIGPPVCAFLLGRRTAQAKWMREFDKRVSEIQRKGKHE